jgi:hypothetical protein
MLDAGDGDDDDDDINDDDDDIGGDDGKLAAGRARNLTRCLLICSQAL